MRQIERSAYLWQVKELISSGQFKEFPGKELIAVLVPKVRISSVRGKVQAVSFYRQGEVLHAIWRKATKEEKEEFAGMAERIKISKSGEVLVSVVMKVGEGLAAGARQRIRHIFGNLIEKKEKGFVIAGDASILSEYAVRLNDLIRPFLKTEPPSGKLFAAASAEYLWDISRLDRNRSKLIRLAAAEMVLARQAEFWDAASHTAAALSAILEERARKYEIALKSLALGVKWLDLYEETRQKFANVYERLGEIAEELETLGLGGKNPSEFSADELKGIYLYIAGAEGSYFHPFCKRVLSKEFQDLKRVPDFAAIGEWESVDRIIKTAQAKIEIFAKGEVPTKGEIQGAQRYFSMRSS